MSRRISLITMSQGNPIALKRTFDSLKNVCDEIIYGDLLIFEEDRALIESYKSEYNLKIAKYQFNYIFKNGFSAILNDLAMQASNDLCLYMNCSEIIDGDEKILELINNVFWEYNCFSFDNSGDPHTWWRLYDSNKIQWRGLIHEELFGERNDCPYYLFRMKDTEKDMDNPFGAAVYNSIKELTYFNQYIKLIDEPKKQFGTNQYWINFAKEQYDSMKERLLAKGKQYEAFQTGDLEVFLNDIRTTDYFKKERFESSDMINYQGNRKSIL